MENPTKQILMVNLGIFAAYTLLSYLYLIGGRKDADGNLNHAIFISVHVIISFLIGVIRLIFYRKEADGGAYILSAILVLIIGFGTCVGIFQVLTHGKGLNL